jgi:short-subunit dehydrogenase
MSSRPVALITGASSGIGETFARRLAARGYDLILVARRAGRLEQLARELPVTVQPLPADLLTEDGLAAVEAALLACPRLELLVNNAGFGTLGRFWETSLSGQLDMHRLHILATVRLTHAALRNMRQGGVINVSSVAAFSSSPGNASYCATKAWMNAFTEGLAMDLRSASSPLRVQALCPGFTVTEFHDTLGVDRAAIPSFLWLKADRVVEASLRGFDRGAVLVVPGWQYKALVNFLHYLPYSLKRRLRRPFRDKRV